MKSFLAALSFIFLAIIPGKLIGNERRLHVVRTNASFVTLRLKWKDVLLGSKTDKNDSIAIQQSNEQIANAQKIWSEYQKETARKDSASNYLWSDLKGDTKSSDMTSAYKRLRTMALGYHNPVTGSALYHNPALKQDIISGLNWMHKYRYHIRKPYNNWFEWEIGNPLALNDLMVLMYDDLNEKQLSDWINVIDHFSPNQAGDDSDYKFWGANRVWRTLVHTIRGIVGADSAKMELARDGLSGTSDGQNGKRSVFKFVTTSDGFYEDGSFIQHYGVAYTGGYGKSLLGNIADVLYMLHETPWQVTDPESKNVYQWVYKAFMPLICKNGQFMDMVRGREIARYATTDIKASIPAITGIIRLSQLAPELEKSNFRKMVKYWLLNNPDLLNGFSVEMLGHAKVILADNAIKPMDEPVANYIYAGMDRAVHLRKGWAFGLSMNSTRQSYYECHTFNFENGKGWYTAEGMTYLYLNDPYQYGDNYWPTVNYHRLPGITVDAGLIRKDQSGYSWSPLTYSSKSWVGGATNGIYGVAGMEQDAWGASLTSKKSWFMFDDEVVALGAGITSTDNRPIQTIIENRKLNKEGTNVLCIKGKTQKVSGFSATYKNTKWIHLSGNVSNSDMGYYFPDGGTVYGEREKRSGKWSDINKFNFPSGDPVVSNYYQELWFDHGSNPQNRTYAYVLLPNKTSAEINTYSNNADIVILQNNSQVQAVKEKKLKITQANFWTDSLVSLTEKGKKLMSSNRKASVLMQEKSGELSVYVSDPTQLNNGSVELEINDAGQKITFADPRVKILQLAPVIKLSIDMKNTFGKSVAVIFKVM